MSRLTLPLLLTVALGACYSPPPAYFAPVVASPVTDEGWERPAPPHSLTFENWRGTRTPRIVTEDEAAAALIEAGMTPHEASRLAYASATCEAPVWDVDGVTSIGIDRMAVGDSGRSAGAFMIHLPAHPWARDLDLTNLDVSAQAAVRVWRAQGLEAWSCLR